METFALAFCAKAAAPRALSASALLVLLFLSGCTSGSTSAGSSSKKPASPQTYLAPYLTGEVAPSSSVSAYAMDDTAQTFSESTYYLGEVNGAMQEGARTYFAGTTASLARGLLSLAVGYDWNSTSPIVYNPPQTGSWAIELPNQAGGMIDINGQPFAPVVPATSCPDFSTPQTYQFLTLPASLLIGGAGTLPYIWDPTQETVFGSVDISGTGSTITFNNIQQYALPSAPGGAPGATATSVTSPQTGACASTYYGDTTVVPANLTVTDPGPNSPSPPVALVGIGPTGLLVESNAANGQATAAPYYVNLLGAGTGAIGLPKPSSALSTSALVGAQYLGFFYGSGDGNNDWSTYVASLGFAAPPAACKTVAIQTSTMIYGGDFPGNNPGGSGVQSNGGFGNCDIAIDLGSQDPNNNGLYPAATVYLGTFAAENGLCGSYAIGPCANYSFPAVAIAGQLGTKYAIFLLGVDTVGLPNQALGIYLLQSN
jgi:hypothetical protein